MAEALTPLFNNRKILNPIIKFNETGGEDAPSPPVNTTIGAYVTSLGAPEHQTT